MCRSTGWYCLCMPNLNFITTGVLLRSTYAHVLPVLLRSSVRNIKHSSGPLVIMCNEKVQAVLTDWFDCRIYPTRVRRSSHECSLRTVLSLWISRHFFREESKIHCDVVCSWFLSLDKHERNVQNAFNIQCKYRNIVTIYVGFSTN